MNIQKSGKKRTTVCLFLMLVLCAGFISAQTVRRNNWRMASGGAETGESSGRALSPHEAGVRRPASGSSMQEKTLAEKRKHPAEILACAPGFAPSGGKADDPQENTAGIFFFGDAAGFLSAHRVSASAGGFLPEMLGIWQISDLPVRCIAPHPDGRLIAVYESDGFSTHRVSLWDWEQKTRLYAKRFQDSINAISWSAAGTYLMVGNTSFHGITFLEGEKGDIRRPYRDSPGIVNLSATGKSERTAVNYAPSGRIVYTDLSSGETVGDYPTEPNLSMTSLCDNNRVILGYNGAEAVAVDATTGETIAAFPADRPVPAPAAGDSLPVWFEQKQEDFSDSDTGYWVLVSGGQEPVRLEFPAGENPADITAAAGADGFRIFGTADGEVYVFDGAVKAENTEALVPVTGLCATDSRLYWIAGGTLYSAENYGEEPLALLNAGENDGLLPAGTDSVTEAGDGNLILWSASSAAPVLLWNGETGGQTELYLPSEGITSLSVTGSGISFVEGNSRAVFLPGTDRAARKNIRSGSAERPQAFVYSAAGLQDAVMVSPQKMLVSRSAGLRSPAPLLLLDVGTGETVPLNAGGDLCFSLAMVNEQEGWLYAFRITGGENGRPKTELIFLDVDPENFSRTKIDTAAVYPDEDLSAELLPLSEERILVTMGKTSLSEIRRQTGSQRTFARGYALPARIAASDRNILTLNYDGSLSWYNTSRRAVGTSALTESGQWLFDRRN